MTQAEASILNIVLPCHFPFKLGSTQIKGEKEKARMSSNQLLNVQD